MIEAEPLVFDAAAFITEVESTNVRIIKSRGDLSFQAKDGFGMDYFDVMMRWTEAIQACPDWSDQLVALVPEWEASHG